MYSLYRAWFGGNGTEENFPRSRETLSPPDTVIRVGNEGEHQFVAHKGVLAAHSGYLKALLAGAATVNNSSSDTDVASNSNVRQPVTSVSVSSIGGEAFAPLLNYMYTGRLEVTLDNVYSVLLATHLLHMPGALEQCRAALLRLRAQPALPTPMGMTGPAESTSSTASGRILRPIPNRPMIGPPPLCWPQPPPLYPSSSGMSHLPQLQPTAMLMQSTMPPAISVIPTSMVQDAQESSARRETSQQIREPTARTSQTMTSVSLPFVAAFTAFAASNAVNQPTETTISPMSASSSPSLSPSSSPLSQSPTFRRGSGSAAMTQPVRRPSKHRREKIERESVNQRATDEEAEQRNSRDRSELSSQNRREKSRESSGGGSGAGGETDRARLAKRRGRSNSCNDDPAGGGSSVVYDVACCDGPVRFHRVLNENYSSPCGRTGSSPRSCLDGPENDENGGQGRSDSGGTASGDPNSASYTCGYCRHTFKSQYCYRKHAKRHLLPTPPNPEEESNRQRRDNARSGREVRLLDLNVQYYPCKICGCKFPSYYFVHKHRKLCHSNVEESSRSNADETEQQEQEQPSRTSYENTNDTTVNIDGHATSMDFDSN